MFFDDWTHKSLFLADKNHGKGLSQFIQNAEGAMDIKAFSFLHRQGTNACSR